MRDNRKHVFIVGSKGIPASYGGFETFVDRLTYYKQSEDIVYHVACLSDTKGRFLCHGADCFRVKVPNIGAVRAIWYDVAALSQSIRYVEEHPEITQPIFYVLACRIGPFIGILWKKIVKIGGTLYVNPDGLEWKRGKWSWPVRKYWKLSAKQMIKRDSSFVTVIYGEDVTDEQAASLESALNEKWSGKVEFTFIKGMQPIYYFIISVE
jgi:rhamnosyltransferase